MDFLTWTPPIALMMKKEQFKKKRRNQVYLPVEPVSTLGLVRKVKYW